MLGIDPVEDADYLYIAEEGIRTPLPENWKPCATDDGDYFYMNIESGETMIEHPLDEHFRMKFMEAKMLDQQLLELPNFLNTEPEQPCFATTHHHPYHLSHLLAQSSIKFSILESERKGGIFFNGRKIGKRAKDLSEKILEAFDAMGIKAFEEDFSPKYEPTREAFMNYAEFLGVDT